MQCDGVGTCCSSEHYTTAANLDLITHRSSLYSQLCVCVCLYVCMCYLHLGLMEFAGNMFLLEQQLGQCRCSVFVERWLMYFSPRE